MSLLSFDLEAHRQAYRDRQVAIESTLKQARRERCAANLTTGNGMFVANEHGVAIVGASCPQMGEQAQMNCWDISDEMIQQADPLRQQAGDPVESIWDFMVSEDFCGGEVEDKLDLIKLEPEVKDTSLDSDWDEVDRELDELASELDLEYSRADARRLREQEASRYHGRRLLHAERFHKGPQWARHKPGVIRHPRRNMAAA